VVVTVSENRDGNTTASFIWTVNANTQPTIVNPGAQTGEVDEFVSLAISASDADGDGLTYSATGLPDGLAIDSMFGDIYGTPTAEGSFNVMVTVTDDRSASADTSFTWTTSAFCTAASPVLIIGATDVGGTGTVPANAIDGNTSTWWSSEGIGNQLILES